MHTRHRLRHLRSSKLKTLDPGANVAVISDRCHLDTNTISIRRRAEDASGVETADEAVMPITGSGIVVGIEVSIMHKPWHCCDFRL